MQFTSKINLQKLSAMMYIVLAFVLPFERRLVPVIIGIIVFLWLIEGKFRKKLNLVKGDRVRISMLAFSILYVIDLIGMINTANLHDGFFFLGVKFSLLIFPVLFATLNSKAFDQHWIRRLLYAFVAGCILAALVCVVYGPWRYFNTGDIKYLIYADLSIFQHPTYFSIQINLAISVLMYFLLDEQSMLKKSWRTLIFVAISFLVFFNILLSSKAGIFGMIMVIFIAIIYLVIKQKMLVRGLLLFVAFLTYIFLLLNVLPGPFDRFRMAEKSITDTEHLPDSQRKSTIDRMHIWAASFQLFKDNILRGVGTGDVTDELAEEYSKQGSYDAMKKRYNAHNQYLQIGIGVGITGVLVLLLILILPFLQALKKGDILYISFLALIGFNLLFESMFETQAGVVFYAFFNALLFYNMHEARQVE